MDEELVLDGLHIAPSVIETIVTMSVATVESVAALGGAKVTPGTPASLTKQRSRTRKGVELSVVDDQLVVDIHVTVSFGYSLKDVAAEIREAIDTALVSQLGIDVGAVNVYIDAMKFED